jgi:VanZ family protein
VIGFRDDEGWWEVGAHLFLMIIPAMVLLIVTDEILKSWFGRSWELPSLLAMFVGIPLGDWVFHRVRPRPADDPSAQNQPPADSA